jgi:hypothetical protein
VATPSTGVIVTWGGTPFSEVSDVSYTYGGSSPKGRSVIWTDDAGTVSISCYGTTNLSTSEYGLRKSLAISGGGFALTVNAILESIGVQHAVNDVTRFSVSFKILDA